jgi:arylsulfatase A
MKGPQEMELIGKIVALLSCLALPVAAQEASMPNVLLIFADDLGYGDVQCYGGKVRTPNIDRLAAEGMRFTKAYLPASVCSPSRYSLLTGRYFWRNPRHPVRGVIGPDSPSAFNDGELTLQKMFRDKGYQTAVFGKWHIGIGKSGVDWSEMEIKGGALDHGFDTFFGTAANVENHPMFYIKDRTLLGRKPGDKVTKVPDKKRPWKSTYTPWDPSVIYKPDEVSHEVTRRLVEYIETAPRDRPFFIYWPTHIPHKPITPHETFTGKTKFGSYGDFLLELDTYVGDVMAALKRAGQLENTLIIFTSDNGGLNPMSESHAKKWHMDPMWEAQVARHITNGPLNDGKHSVLDGGFRVPFIVRWPGRIPAGKTTDQLICSTDMMATCAALLDYKLPADAAVDSVDLLPLWTGKSANTKRDHVVLVAPDETFAISRGTWKFIEKNPKGRRRGSTEDQLYDVEKDIGETRNLVAQHPEVVKAMRKILDDERRQAKGIDGVAYPRSTKKPDAPPKAGATSSYKEDFSTGVVGKPIVGWRSTIYGEDKSGDVKMTVVEHGQGKALRIQVKNMRGRWASIIAPEVAVKKGTKLQATLSVTSSAKQSARFFINKPEWKQLIAREFSLADETRTIAQEMPTPLQADTKIYFRLDLPNDSDTILDFVEIKSE